MSSRKLSRLQKAGALVPMAILVSGWAVAVGNSGLASAIGGGENEIPQVPATALEQPAVARTTVGGIDPQAGFGGTIATLSTNGIPSAALYAYHHAETVLAEADPGCHLPWHLVAAIGRVESNHGRIQGNALNAEGVDVPGITKPEVGPMQLHDFPAVAIDADGDGKKNPQDIDDAATAAGIFLCSGEGDLSTDSGARAAVARYGSGAKYVDSVMKISAQYASGFYSQTPDGYSTSTILTSRAYDATLTADERASAKRDEDEAERQRNRKSSGGGSTSGRTSGGTSGGNTSGGDDGGSDGGGDGNSDGGGDGGSDGGGSNNPVQNVTRQVQDTVEHTTDTVHDTVKNTTDTVNNTVKRLGDALRK